MDKNRFSHLLSSNDAPELLETIELGHIRDKITADIHQLAMLNHRQPDLVIQSHVRELDGRLNDFGMVLSPLRRVPPELIAEIIAMSLLETSSPTGRATLIQTCLVCKTWRAAALSKHTLWTDLELDLGSSRYEKAALWFGRSGSFPRSLRISSLGTPTPGRTESLGKILSCGPTLDRLHLSMRNTAEWANILQSIRGTPTPSRAWNSLRSLGLRFNLGNWNNPSFGQLPRVKAFQLYLPSMGHAFPSTDSCAKTTLDFRSDFLHNLTDLQIHFDWPPGPIIPILERCSNLEKLHIDFESTPLFPFGNVPTLHFPRLKSLHLSGITSIEPLGFILAPILQHLHLDFHISSYFDPLYLDSSEVKEIWPTFVHRHAGITSLYIQDVVIDTTAFRALFSTSNPLPHLTHLTLDRISWDSKITRADSWRRLFSPRVLLRYVRVFPCLESFSLLRVDGDFLELDALLNFVEEQEGVNVGSSENHPNLRGSGPGIRRFTLTYHETDGPDSISVGHGPEIQARIDSLNRGGTLVRVGPKFKPLEDSPHRDALLSLFVA